MTALASGLLWALPPQKSRVVAAQVMYAAERFRERTGLAATTVECHPSEAESFDELGYDVAPDIRIARGTFRIGRGS